jgi:putative hydrolase
VSDPEFPAGGNFFQGLLGDLLKMLHTEGPLNWELARQLAHGVATGNQPEPNVDPVDRIRLEELARVADLHVADATGFATSVTGKAVSVVPVSRGQWAWRTLEGWRPLLEAMAASLSPAEPERPEAHPELSATEGADFEELMGQWASAMGPTLIGLQFGSTVGHLAQRSLGQYDLPIPRPESDEIIVVPQNLASFSKDWSLPLDDVRLWVCLTEIAHHAVIGRPHVRARLLELLHSYVTGFRPDATGLEARLADVDPSDPASVQRALGDPSALLGEIQTPEQHELLRQLDALTATIEGYVDHLVDAVGQRLIGSFGPLAEALRRRRVEKGEGERFVERMFGLGLGQDQFERGTAFVEGVVERSGEDALAGLWVAERNLPTPAEVDAPGLWLERISLPEDL